MELRRHSTGSHVTSCGSLTHSHKFIGKIIHLADELRVRVFLRIVGVEAVDIGEKE